MPAEGGAEAAAAGCSKAAGPAGSNHSHLAGHTEVASVKKVKQSKQASQNVQFMKSNMVSTQQHEVGSLLGK